MLAPLLPLAIIFILFATIIFLIYHFAGKKAGKIASWTLAILYVGALAFSLFGLSSTAPKSVLHITEWRLSLPLTHDISDAYYTLEGDEVYISTKRLDKMVDRIQGCTSGLHGLYYKRDPHNSIKLEKGQPRVEPACVVEASADTDKIGTLQDAIQAAAQSTTAK
jgi:hypothetical protein